MSTMNSPTGPTHSRMAPAQDSKTTATVFFTEEQQATVFNTESLETKTGSKPNPPNNAKAPREDVANVLNSVQEDRSLERKLASHLAELNGRIDQFGEQLNKFDANFKLINDRLNALDQRVDSVTTANETTLREIQSKTESTTTTVDSDASDLVTKIESRFASLENIFKNQAEMVNGFLANTEVSGNVKAETIADVKAETNQAPEAATEPTATEEKDPSADWQEQKQAMMAKYGFDSETETTSSSEKSDANEPNPSPTDAEKPSSPEEEASVDELKQQLNSKIREAEVEMSINRARQMQERVEFERAQADLERRAASLEAKLAASKGNKESTAKDNTAGGMMGRFNRHLGNK